MAADSRKRARRPLLRFSYIHPSHMPQGLESRPLDQVIEDAGEMWNDRKSQMEVFNRIPINRLYDRSLSVLISTIRLKYRKRWLSFIQTLPKQENLDIEIYERRRTEYKDLSPAEIVRRLEVELVSALMQKLNGYEFPEKGLRRSFARKIAQHIIRDPRETDRQKYVMKTAEGFLPETAKEVEKAKKQLRLLADRDIPQLIGFHWLGISDDDPNTEAPFVDPNKVMAERNERLKEVKRQLWKESAITKKFCCTHLRVYAAMLAELK